MNEFQIIENFFKLKARSRPEVVLGIGDDCAVLNIPSNEFLLVSTDTLVSGVHFLPTWEPGDIAYKAVMVNVSDCAAMGGKPFAISLALTVPEKDSAWLSAFSDGLHEALAKYNIALIGGDLTKGPLTITITIHGLSSKPITRKQARPGDKIYVSGELGLAAYTVFRYENTHASMNAKNYHLLKRIDILNNHTSPDTIMKKSLHFPTPRLDFVPILNEFATAAIDISDGLLADLNHICESSGVGAQLNTQTTPVHSLLKEYTNEGLRFALMGGDDYELCFTVPPSLEDAFIIKLKESKLSSYCIGEISDKKGVWDEKGKELKSEGFRHF